MISHFMLIFLAVMVLAFSIYLIFDVLPGVTPFIALSADLCVITIFAYFNRLFAGCVAVCAATAVLFVCALRKEKNLKEKAKNYFRPGIVIFLLFSLGVIIYFGIRQPVYSTWDEFSFWGTAHKLTKINNAIYTFYESSMIGVTTPPTLTLLSYFFQFFTEGFSQWVGYAAYDVLFFAVFSAFAAGFDWKNRHKAFMGFIAGFFGVYFFRVFVKTSVLITLYMDSLADIPLAVIAAGCFALYLNGKTKMSGILCMLPSVFMLTGVKDMGFALSNILAFLVFTDMFFSKDEVKIGRVKGFFAKAAGAVMVEATAVASFARWTVHMSKVMSVNRFELGGETNIGMAQMIIQGVTQLFSKEPIPKFAAIRRSMIDAFFTYKVCLLGSGLAAAGIITAVFMLAAALSEKADRVRVFFVYIASAVSFAAYYIFHLFIYVYIFKDNGYNLEGYTRYLSTIYTFWLLLSVLVLLQACRRGEKKAFASLSMLGYSAFLAAVALYGQGPQTAFYNYNNITFENHRLVRSKADSVRDAIGEEDRLYLICAGDSGMKWFIYTYELAENVIYRDMPELDWTLTDPEETAAMKEDFARYLKLHGITHLLIDAADDDMRRFFADDIDWQAVGDFGLYDLCYFEVEYRGDHAEFKLVKKGTADERYI